MSAKPSSNPARPAEAAAGSDPAGDANVMWGGRFASGPDALMASINASIGFDKRLYAQDIRASKAHCEMLMAQGIIAPDTGREILSGLDRVLAEIEDGSFTFSSALKTSTSISRAVSPS